MVMVNAIVLFKSYCSYLSRMTVTKVYTKFDNPKKGIPQTTDLLEPPKKPGTSDPVHLKNCESQFVTND
jgi:hypothetical protein